MTAKRIVVAGILLMVVIGTVLVTGCMYTQPATDYSAISPNNICSPIDYTGGVYYFPCTAAMFGNSIAKWKTDHPDTVILTITGDDTYSQGYTRGYFVVTEPRK